MEFSAKQIAELIQGRVEGNPDACINTFAKIEEGKPGAISFLSNTKYINYIYETESSVVLVDEALVLEKPVKATLIRVKSAYEAVAKLLQMYDSMKPKRKGIDSLAFIDPTAKIGEDCYIGPFVAIGPNVTIGNGCVLHPHVTIGQNATVGNNTEIYSNAVIYHDCKVGNNCILHAGCVVGATRGEMFKDVRKIAPDHFLLVPGVGAQGGSLQEVCEYGMTKDCGLLVNSSRGIIYADNTEFFADTAAKKAKELQEQMAAELGKLKIDN